MSGKPPAPDPEYAARYRDMSTRDLRFHAYRLIDAKLTGDKRAQALGFVTNTRTGSAIDRLCERLESLPDIPREVAANSSLSAAQVKAIRNARLQGVKVGEIADRFGISISSVYRICGGSQQKAVTS